MMLRFLTALAAALLAAPLTAPGAIAQTIYPIDRATILAGAHFDFKVEFGGVIQASAMRVTINGQDYGQVLGGQGQLIEREDGEARSSLMLRDVAITAPGRYEVVATDGTNRASVTWEVYGTPAPRRARNVILFIGDGMSVGHVTAARILSRGIRQGRYNSPLTIDQFPAMAMIGTSGADSIVTDSANSAHAYTTGHKSSVNALGVYASRARNNTEHPRVETITTIVQRRHNMAVGVVTNTEIEDATPASMVAHTRRRSDYDIIVGQFLAARPDVIMGGGSSNFIPRTTPGSRRGDDIDYIARFREAGYGVATNLAEMNAAASQASTRRLLALFHPRNMDGALDRFFLRANTVQQFPNQPDLTEQVSAALQILSRNENGFFMMVESGHIDKYSHPLDWERAVYDTIMLDNAVRVAVDWAGNRNDTLIVVVPDHTHGISIVGTVDDDRPGEDMRERIGVYEQAGFPNYPPPNAQNYPPRVDVSRRLAVFYASFPDYYETFRPHLEGTNVPAIQGPNQRYVANERYRDVPGAMLRVGNLPRSADTGVHTADDVVLRAWGPGSEMAHGFMDNTEVFRLIANALALAPPQ